MKWEQPSPRCDQWLNARCYEARDSRTKTSLTIIGLATTIYAGLLHCFNVETFAREESTARSIFDDSAEESRKHVFYASNQGVYTLFFALGGLIGAILACVSHGEGTLFVVGNNSPSLLPLPCCARTRSVYHIQGAPQRGHQTGCVPLDCGGRPRDWAGDLKGENVHITKWARTLTPSVIRYEA